MRIATFNVNSLKARLEVLLAWIGKAQPDVVCLQETKLVDDQFPRFELEAAGYNCAMHGQKTYNGVAVLSKRRFEEVAAKLPGDEADDHSRYIEAIVPSDFGPVRVVSLYAPNGNPAPGAKYDYKLAWMRRLEKRVAELLALEEPLVLAGDYNVIPSPDDVWDAGPWRADALYLPASRSALRSLQHLGLTDAFRACHAEAGRYSFWDYQAGAWQKNHGIRIDHLLLSPQAADRLKGAEIDAEPRGWERPSDHVPVWCDLLA
ncbi:MAG: exodeoxyribonuclease III [Alphaproteobacteria bacterium]